MEPLVSVPRGAHKIAPLDAPPLAEFPLPSFLIRSPFALEFSSNDEIAPAARKIAPVRVKRDTRPLSEVVARRRVCVRKLRVRPLKF